MSEYKHIYNILNSVFRPDQVVNEVDEDPVDDSNVDSTDDQLDSEIDGTDLPDDAGETDLDSDDTESSLDSDIGDDMGSDMGDDSGFGDSGFGDTDFGNDDESPDTDKKADVKPEPIGPQASDSNLSGEQKIDKLFSDTGDIAFDYGTGTEPNLRLSRFKFVNAGIDPEMYMDENEKRTGVPSIVVEDRLSPEQKDEYIKANQKLREKYPKVAEREKNILIYNSGVPFVKYDLENNEQPIEEPSELNQAYKRIDEYMSKRFGVNWQDKRKAVELLKTIKVNFDDKQKIQPNLISSDNFTSFSEDGLTKIPFNKVPIETPSFIGEFIRSNIQNPEFTKSSIFNSMSSTYTTGKGKSESPYAIIKGQGSSEETTAVDTEEEPDFGEDPDLDDTEEPTGDEDTEVEI